MKIIRQMLRHNDVLYNAAAALYHSCKNFFMRSRCKMTGVMYLRPRNPQGPFKSQYGQDYHLYKLGLLSSLNYFVEVGASDPELHSNTYFLEHQLGFQGISIDALDFKGEYKDLRPNTIFLCALIDSEIKNQKFYVVQNEDGWEHQLSSINPKTMNVSRGYKSKPRLMDTTPLKELVTPTEKYILFCDVEGHELKVLESLDWEIPPEVAVIENNGYYHRRSKLVRYMQNRGYKLFARVGSYDDVYVRNV